MANLAFRHFVASSSSAAGSPPDGLILRGSCAQATSPGHVQPALPSQIRTAKAVADPRH